MIAGQDHRAGVRHVVQVGDSGVAVVADTWWQAKTALDALPIAWDEGPNAKVSSATIADMLKEGLGADQAFVNNQNGDAKAATARAITSKPSAGARPVLAPCSPRTMSGRQRTTVVRIAPVSAASTRAIGTWNDSITGNTAAAG